jgi:hypothetical protein
MSMLTFESYYESLGDNRYAATRATESPWDHRLQHGSPPTALLVHAIERAYPRVDVRVARVNADFLGPIPRDELRVHTTLVRPGKRVEMLEATLEDRSGRAVAAVRVWRIAIQPDPELEARAAIGTAPALPAGAEPELFGIPRGTWGYADATEWRYRSGHPNDVGPAAVWARARAPLIKGEPLTGLDRILLLADSANGISNELSFDDWLFIPPSLSIAIQRYADGDWIGLDAKTTLGPDGQGITTFTLEDRHGYLGAGTQSLLVERRRKQ